MKIELYYFDGCPSWKQALENLERALREEGIVADVETIRVESEADAEAKRFIGSPTIRIDGVDLEGPQAEEKGYGFGCRVYAYNGRYAPFPSVEQIRAALAGRR